MLYVREYFDKRRLDNLFIKHAYRQKNNLNFCREINIIFQNKKSKMDSIFFIFICLRRYSIQKMEKEIRTIFFKITCLVFFE